MRKMREDSTWNGLTGEQRQKLENWLFERNLGYVEALKRAHKEFGVQSLFGNYEGRCGEGFWLWPRRRVPRIPAAGCKERVNAGHGQKTRRPEGFRGKGRLASPCSRMLSELLRGGRAQRLLRRASPSGLFPENSAPRSFQTGSEGGCRKASVHAAAFSHFGHIEPSSGWFGYRRGEETAPCMGCRRRLPPEGGVPGSREVTAPCLAVRGGAAGARAGLASDGGSADAPACGQAVGARLVRTNLDLGRARWTRRNAQRMNGKAKGLNERNTFFIYDPDARRSGLEENVRLCSPMFAYVRLIGKKCLRRWMG